MIKCKYLLLVVCLVWAGSILNAQWCVAPDSPIEQQSGISKTVKDQGNGRVLYSYCSSDAAVTAKSGIGSNTDDDVKVTTAIRLSEGMMGLLKGRNIYSLKVGIAADADDATVFIRKEDGTILWQITKALELGWNDVVLENPLVIPGDQPLYIGFSAVQHDRKYLIPVAKETGKVNGLFLSANGEPLTEYTSMGNLCLKVEVDGNESEFGYVASMLKAYSTKPYLLEGKEAATDMTIYFLNEGENSISKIKLGRKLNDKELSDTICTFKRRLRANSLGELTLKVAPTESGNYTFTLKEIEKTPVSVKPIMAGVTIYKAEDAIKRVVLIEEFTSQSCGNCPAGQKALHKVISGNEDRVALVLHHSGYEPDIFTKQESVNYCYFYNTTTYAPAMMIDRTHLSDYDTDGVGSLVFDPRNFGESTFTKELALPALVSVDINCSYDEASRKLTVIVSGNKTVDLVGDHVGVTVFLLESNYIGYQHGNGGGSEFEHNNFLRAVLSDQTGDVISFAANGTYSKRYEYKMPETYVSTTGKKTEAHPENMSIVAFVSNFDTVYPDNCFVLNANKTTSLNAGETGLKSEKAIEKSLPAFAKEGKVYVCGEYEDLKVYNLQGMEIRNEDLKPGVYIVKIIGSDKKEYVRKVYSLH